MVIHDIDGDPLEIRVLARSPGVLSPAPTGEHELLIELDPGEGGKRWFSLDGAKRLQNAIGAKIYQAENEQRIDPA